MALRAITPDVYPWFPYRDHTFCLGLTDGKGSWTSGQSASAYDDAAGRMTVEGTMAEQTRLSYRKLLDVLADEGLTAQDVVHVTENVTAAGTAYYDDAVGVRADVFDGHAPTVTTVMVDRLVRSKALIEIELYGVSGGGEVLVEGDIRGPVREGHDGAVHLPTILPLDIHGRVVHPGAPVEQYRWCLNRAAALIEAAGLEVGQVVACHEYVRETSRARISELRRLRHAALGGSTVGGTVVMDRLHHEGVEVALDITASRLPQTVVDPGWLRFADEPMVPSIRVGKALYLSALSALHRNSGEIVAPGDLAGQAQELYEQMVELLAAVGANPADLLSTVEFCQKGQIANYRAVAGVRRRLLSPPWPASTGDLCSGFPHPDLLIQTTAVAHLGSSM